jgi:hypothetical protein
LGSVNCLPTNSITCSHELTLISWVTLAASEIIPAALESLIPGTGVAVAAGVAGAGVTGAGVAAVAGVTGACVTGATGVSVGAGVVGAGAGGVGASCVSANKLNYIP